MISGQAFLLQDGLYAWGDGTAGDSLVFQSTGIELDGATLFQLVPGTSATAGHWEPVTNGDPDNPGLVYYNGDVVMYWVTG